MRDKILNELIKNNTIERMAAAFNQYIPSNQFNDFVQEIWLIICELPDEKLIKLYNEGTLEFYLLTIIKNQATNKLSKFNTTYNKITTVEFNEGKESV